MSVWQWSGRQLIAVRHALPGFGVIMVACHSVSSSRDKLSVFRQGREHAALPSVPTGVDPIYDYSTVQYKYSTVLMWSEVHAMGSIRQCYTLGIEVLGWERPSIPKRLCASSATADAVEGCWSPRCLATREAIIFGNSCVDVRGRLVTGEVVLVTSLARFQFPISRFASNIDSSSLPFSSKQQCFTKQ